MDKQAEIGRLTGDLRKLLEEQQERLKLARFGGMDNAEAANYEDLQNRIQRLIERLGELE